MQLVLFVILFLSSHLASAQVDRTALVDAGYRQIEQLLSFAADDKKFIATLNAAEKVQLESILDVVRKTAHLAFSPSGFNGMPVIDQFIDPHEYTGKPPKIEYSSDSNSFILNPGESPRSARTQSEFEAPIVFNLNILNSLETKPSYLDILQILVHEFGHKVTYGKDQTAIDGVAAKFKAYLQKYYVQVKTGHVTVEAVSIPMEIKYQSDDPFYRQKNVPVIIDNNGMANYSYMSFYQMRQGSMQFQKVSGNMDEIISVRLTRIRYTEPQPPHPQNLSIGFEFDFQIKSDVMYVDPNVGLKDSGGGMFSPIYRYIPLLSKSQFQTRTYTDVRMGLRKFFDDAFASPLSMHSYTTSSLADRTVDYNLISQKKLGDRLQFTFAQSAAPEKVTAIIENANGEMLVETIPVFRNEKVVSYILKLPQSSNFSIKRLMINDEDSVTLSKAIVIGAAVPAEKKKRTRIEDVKIFVAETNKWIKFDPAQMVLWNDPEMRFRIVVDKNFNPEQLQLHWTVGQRLFVKSHERTLGILGTAHTEIIKGFTVVASDAESKTIEFTAQPFTNIVPAKARPLKSLQVDDSGHRFLKEIEAVDSSHTVVTALFRERNNNFPFTGEGFKINNIFDILNAIPGSCKGLF